MKNYKVDTSPALMEDQTVMYFNIREIQPILIGFEALLEMDII